MRIVAMGLYSNLSGTFLTNLEITVIAWVVYIGRHCYHFMSFWEFA